MGILRHLQQSFMIGSNSLKREECNLMTTHEEGDRHNKKSRKYLSCAQLISAEEDRRDTIEETVNKVGIAQGSALTILTQNLHLSKPSVTMLG
nr:hypothetical transcript [Hymenolepis microstoma]